MADLLKDKTAIVTGAAQGLGRAVAEALASEGARVIVTDINETGAKDVAAGLDGAEAEALDVRDDARVEAVVNGVAERHGKVDIVVANAGIATVTPLAEMTMETWRSVMAVNLDGVFSSIRYAGRSMATTGGGSIIAMASITGFAGSPLIGHYAAAKAGVINLVKTAAVEFKAFNIRVNAICPGWIGTDLVLDRKGQFEEILGVDWARWATWPRSPCSWPRSDPASPPARRSSSTVACRPPFSEAYARSPRRRRPDVCARSP